VKSCAAVVLLAMCCGLFAAEESSAENIASEIIRARALSCGDAEIGKQLRLLADGVETGRIDIAQARQVLDLVSPPKIIAAETKAPTAEQPAVTAQQVTAILDGGAPPTQPSESAAPIEELPAAQSTGSGQAPKKPAFATTVLAVNRSSANELIMIGAGQKDGIKEGQRFAIRRQLKTIVVCAVTQVKDTMSVCTLIPGTWDEAHESVREGDDAVAVE
jgi:hypothetical protein